MDESPPAEWAARLMQDLRSWPWRSAAPAQHPALSPVLAKMTRGGSASPVSCVLAKCKPSGPPRTIAKCVPTPVPAVAVAVLSRREFWRHPIPPCHLKVSETRNSAECADATLRG